MNLLSTSEVAVLIKEFLGPLHPLAKWVAFLAGTSAPMEAISEAEEEFGMLGDPSSLDGSDSALLLWLGRGGGSQLVLKLPSGRYRIEYWASRSESPLGVEIACAPSLVISPPCSRPLAALVRKLSSH